MELRPVVDALQLNAALREPRAIRPQLNLFIALPNLEEDIEVPTYNRRPQKCRPRLRPANAQHVYRRCVSPAPRRHALREKLYLNPRRTGGPPAHAANFAPLPLTGKLAVLLTTAPRRILRRGTMIGSKDGVKKGVSDCPPSSPPLLPANSYRAGPRFRSIGFRE